MRAIIQKIIGGASLVIIFSIGLTFHALAQTSEPKILLTWRAESYTPPGFMGKILPGVGSRITASLEIIENGSPADISSDTVLWYLDRDLVGRGSGLKTINFNAGDIAGGAHSLRIKIENYRGGDQTILKTINIPVAQPKIVLAAPFPNFEFSTPTIHIKALPFFFAVTHLSDINFAWSVNGEQPVDSANPDILDISTAKVARGSNLSINLAVQNPKNTLESAIGTINLKYK